MTTKLITEIRLFVVKAPQEIVERLASACETSNDWETLTPYITTSLYSASLSKQLLVIIQEAKLSQYSPRQIALALRSAKEVAEVYKTQQSVELVWTGPRVAPFVLRRTDEALLQMISNAHESLTIVSFAIYKVERIFEALRLALSRQVEIQFYLETDAEKIDGGSANLLRLLPSEIKVYTWSPEHRPHNRTGQYGALHAKVAIADNSSLLVSSANFTEHAMSLNIELGLMVTGGSLPMKANQLLRDLTSQGIFIQKV